MNYLARENPTVRKSLTVATTYDANGNVLTRADARGITTTYAYDALNRLTSKSYSDGTPVANFWYDASHSTFGNWTVTGQTNMTGRLNATCTSNAVGTCPGGYTGTVYSYDALGRVAGYWQCTPYNCGSSAWETTYQYDLAGDVSSWTNPGGRVATVSDCLTVGLWAGMKYRNTI